MGYGGESCFIAMKFKKDTMKTKFIFLVKVVVLFLLMAVSAQAMYGSYGVMINSPNEVVLDFKAEKRLNVPDYLRIDHVVEGVIIDQEGVPLIGVNIQVKGSNKGTATDFDGRFILDDIDENAILVISYIGYQTQEIYYLDVIVFVYLYVDMYIYD